jgi:hypothetical protein
VSNVLAIGLGLSADLPAGIVNASGSNGKILDSQPVGQEPGHAVRKLVRRKLVRMS